MTLAEKLKDLIGRDYNDMDPDLLDMHIRELKATDISPAFNDSYRVDPLHNVFTCETLGVMVHTTCDDVIDIRFEEEVYDNLDELRHQSNMFKA